jgi:hypothetical protein
MSLTFPRAFRARPGKSVSNTGTTVIQSSLYFHGAFKLDSLLPPNLRVTGVPPEADQVSGVREEKKKLNPEH